ncbi:MAG TPA: M28 family peptidase [Acidobacteriaceae bacterium]
MQKPLAGWSALWGESLHLNRWTWLVCGAAVLFAAPIAGAQRPRTWTVKPEWVRAHEEFLASDAMQGRGSATHDEEVTAIYVASEFRAYGLKTAPGMMGYIQRAEVMQPILNGQGTITAGGTTLEEGGDFHLLLANGKPASGPLLRLDANQVKNAKISAGTVLLVEHLPAGEQAMQTLRSLYSVPAAAVLLEEGDATRKVMEMTGGKPRIPMRLADAPERRPRPTIVALTQAAMTKMGIVKDGETVALALPLMPQKSPRYTYNAIGYLPGTDAKAGTILLSAHLDHLGMRPGSTGDGIYNGANDDAAGTTAVLELAHALASGPRLRRSVLFVCYGSEEAGELGSTYFGEHPPVPLKRLVANLEFEMIGSQDPKMPKGVLLFTGWDRSNLGPALKRHGALLGADPYPEQHFFERSDNYALALKGVVAHTAAGWGTPPTYHQPDDDLQHLDVAFMTAAIQSLVNPVRWLADSSFVPAWNKGGQPKLHE